MKNYSINSNADTNVQSKMEDDVPPHVFSLIAEFLVGIYDQDVDLRKPHLRESLRDFLPLVIVMYGLIILFSFVSNVAIIVHIVYYKLAKDSTYTFVLNNAISDVVKCAIVLPISLYVLLIQNWVLGELLCSFLPMLQDIPFHVTTLTFVMTAWDRCRFITDPSKQRLPAFVCAVGTWLTAVCLVLPFPIYIIYIDLGRYSETFEGIGFCVVNLTDDMQEYMRGIFLIMYAGPLATISYLYIKSSRALNVPPIVVTYGTRSSIVDARNRSQNEGDDHIELNPSWEKRINKYLSAMVTIFAICFCPLMILRVARLALLETYDNAAHFDIIYTALVWIAFLPTCSTPILYASWHLSRETKERLHGCFRKRFRASNLNVARSTEGEDLGYVVDSLMHPVSSSAFTDIN